MFVLELNGVELDTSITTNSHFYARTLKLDIDYTYSLVAMSCAGNSTVTASNMISVG